MAYFNQVTIMGNLGADPEFRTLNNGERVCNLRLAVSEQWRDKGTGNKKERTDWITVVCFNEHINKVLEEYVVKGSNIMVQGALQTRSWEKDGDKRYATEVVISKFKGEMKMIGSKRDGEGGGSDGRYSGYRDGGGGQSSGYSGGGGGGEFSGQDGRGNPREDFQADLDDEIPFVTQWSVR